jgi:hypothetical protein
VRSILRASGFAGLALASFWLGPLAAQKADSSGSATLSDSGIVVRFPRFLSPDSISREMPVMDLFSGYEWRVVLLAPTQALLSALVLAPNDSLQIHRVRTIQEVYMHGDLRQCRRTDNDIVLTCDRQARGLVRDANGCVEIAILDPRWLLAAMEMSKPTVRLIVKRARDVLWTRDIPLVVHTP